MNMNEVTDLDVDNFTRPRMCLKSQFRTVHRFAAPKRPDRPERTETPAKKIPLPVGSKTLGPDDGTSGPQVPIDPVSGSSALLHV